MWNCGFVKRLRHSLVSLRCLEKINLSILSHEMAQIYIYIIACDFGLSECNRVNQRNKWHFNFSVLLHPDCGDIYCECLGRTVGLPGGTPDPELGVLPHLLWSNHPDGRSNPIYATYVLYGV